MSKSADVFNLMDSFLPRADLVELVEPGEVLLLYAGIGMPSIRVTELDGRAGDMYHEIKAGNPLLGLVDPIRLRILYVQLREQALNGDEDALNDLGWLWLNGSRLKPNPELARRLFKVAAAMGSAEALYNLAELAFYGKGLVVDPGLAIDYYEQAFKAGIPCAAAALGGLYECGDDGIPADHAKAISWYKRAAVEQDVMACFSLGKLALDDSSSEYDPPLGVYWLQWAAMRGLVLATERLIDFYFPTLDSLIDPDGLLFRFWRDIAIMQGSAWAIELRGLDRAVEPKNEGYDVSTVASPAVQVNIELLRTT